MDSPVAGLLVTSVFGFLTTIATILYQGVAASRQRRWDREDADKKAVALEKAIVDAAVKVALDHAAAAEALRRETRLIAQKLDENTKLTEQVGDKADKAYKEANDLNMKIADLHEAGNAILRDERK